MSHYLSCWDILEIAPTKDKQEIKRAYAKKTIIYHPEENPEEFKTLQNAYKNALAYAKTDNNHTINHDKEIITKNKNNNRQTDSSDDRKKQTKNNNNRQTDSSDSPKKQAKNNNNNRQTDSSDSTKKQAKNSYQFITYYRGQPIQITIEGKHPNEESND